MDINSRRTTEFKLKLPAKRLRDVIIFTLAPMAGFITPLVALPAITSRFGAGAWASVAIGQSIGAAGAVFVELGWGLNGPQRVARASGNYRRQYLALSLITKGVALVPACVISATAAFLLTENFKGEAAAIAIGTTAASISSAWYYIGTRSPVRLLLADVLPKVLLILFAAIWILQGGPLLLYPVLGMIVPAVLIVAFAMITERVNASVLLKFKWKHVWRTLQLQGAALRARAVSGLYIALPVTLVSIAYPPVVAVFAGAERLQRLALQILTAVPNMMQGWVGSAADMETRKRRAQRAIWVNAGIGLMTGIIYTVVAPTVATLIFSGTIVLPPVAAALSGLMIFIVCTSRATGSIALVNIRDIASIARSALLGAIIGVPAILLGSYYYGLTGALAAEILAEAVVLLYQIHSLRKRP